MSGNLSQEEIDALLRSQNAIEEPIDKPVAATPPLLTRKEKAEPVQESTPEASVKAPSIHTVSFPKLEADSPLEVPVAGMDVLLDVPLAISVELGRARCFVKDLLNLSSGSVVELDRAAGDTVDILVNGKLFARGEVVVIDENFGVRIQEIVHKR
jgi:flagellar motor switch protein FliN/FliY